MPSDSRNLTTMAKATGLIFLLFDIASAQEVPFSISLYMQCILHGFTRAFLCVPFIFAHHKKCQFCGRHVIRFCGRPLLDDVLYDLYTAHPTIEVNPCILHQNNGTTITPLTLFCLKRRCFIASYVQPVIQQYESTTVKKNSYNQNSHYENYGRFPLQMEAIT